MKLTKIIATIGPSCETEEILERLILEGVDIFRFNLKHNTIAWHEKKINLVTKIASRLGKLIGILIDLQGQEIRMKLPKDSIDLKINDKLLLSEEGFLKKEAISFSHPIIINELKNNDNVLVDDGRFEFKVKKDNNKTYLISLSEGRLGDLKSVTIPHLKISLPLFSKKDLEGIKLAQKSKIDFIALSFVRTKKDILTLKEILKREKINAKIIAKIETALAIKNLKEIIEVSDGIMVARGDLGVELPLVDIGLLQKKIINEGRKFKKPVITATQMLESMINNPYPTRAEISDITNAFFDGTDATMLSGETANGKFPIETVKYMAKTLSLVEERSTIDFNNSIVNFESIDDQEKALINSAFSLYESLSKLISFKKIAFLVFTQTGRSAHLLSSMRPKSPIYAIVPDKKNADFLTLNYGIYPFVDEETEEGRVTHNIIEKKVNILTQKGLLKKNLTLIVLHGDVWGKVGGISTIRIIKI